MLKPIVKVTRVNYINNLKEHRSELLSKLGIDESFATWNRNKKVTIPVFVDRKNKEEDDDWAYCPHYYEMLKKY